MGIDLLDIKFRIEKEFGIKLDREFFLQIIEQNNPRFREPAQPRPDITAGQIWEALKHLLAAHNRLSERTELETGIPRESWLALLRERYCQPDLSMSSETESLWKHVVTTQEWEVLSQLLEVQLPQLNTSPLWIELTIILVTFIAPSTYTFVAASLRLPASSSS